MLAPLRDWDLAREVAETAELQRKTLAVDWLGSKLPPWSEPCPINVHVGAALGNGGATSFSFQDGAPSGWRMTVQGNRQRVLDSALPHEILHTLLATHFGRPLPRWADEGAAINTEHASEKAKTELILRQCLTSGRGVPFSKLVEMVDYPADVLPMYSQSYSLVKFLIERDGGRLAFVEYVEDALDNGDWPAATKRHYGYDSLVELQVAWNAWIAYGVPSLANKLPADVDSPDQPDNNVICFPLPGAVHPPTTGQPPSGFRPTLSITDVIRLVEAGVDSDVIVRHARRHCLATSLTTDDLILLTKNGADVAVITALQKLPVGGP